MSEKCRACGAMLPNEAMLVYENMPKSAQFFPTRENVSEDRGVSIVLHECSCCGLVQAVGTPVPYYRDVIRASGVSEEMTQFRVSQFGEWVKKYSLEGKKIIEIGSGHGEYLRMAMNSGAKIYGLEHDPDAVKSAAAEGLNLIEGFVESSTTDIQGAPYDGFFCLNFLEHIPEPGLFLQGIARNLTDDGCGLVEVPNFDMMLENSLYSEFIQDHLSYFTADTLVNLLNNNGFEVVSIKEIWYRYIISAEVRKRRKTDVSCMTERLSQLRKQVHSYLDSCSRRGLKVAAWGAGHQALANLSLLGMADKIEFVIDSADFKQNKLTPATHLSVVSPEILKQGDIGAVIIMAGGYSQEISGLLAKNFPAVERSILGDEFNIVTGDNQS